MNLSWQREAGTDKGSERFKQTWTAEFSYWKDWPGVVKSHRLAALSLASRIISRDWYMQLVDTTPKKSPARESVYHMLVYAAALVFSYNAYKGYRKGASHLARYVGQGVTDYLVDYLPSNPLPKGLGNSLIVIIPVFAAVYLFFRLARKDRWAALSQKELLVITAIHAAAIASACLILNSDMAVVVLLSFPVFIFFIYFCALVKKCCPAMLRFKGLAVEGLSSALEKHNRVVCGAIALLGAVTVIASSDGIGTGQVINMLFILLLAFTATLLTERVFSSDSHLKGASVFLLYMVCSFMVFYTNMWNIFEADYWYIATLFNGIKTFDFETVKRISLFEMFGHPRFQPVAHMLIYARHLAFGNEVWLHELLNISLHALTGFCVFYVSSAFSRDTSFSILLGLLFLVLPSQFTVITWTYHIYIILGTIFILVSIGFSYKYACGEAPRYLMPMAMILSVLSILLYEPAIAAPFAMFLFILFTYRARSSAAPVLSMPKVLVWAGLAYLLYSVVMMYGLTLVKPAEKLPLHEAIKWNNLWDNAPWNAVVALATNIFETTIIKNLSIIDVRSGGAIEVYLPENILNFSAIIKVLTGALILFFFRITKENKYAFLILAALAATYLYVIFLGRSITNVLSYMVSQPRYQYFSNSIFIVLLCLLLMEKAREKKFRVIIFTALFALFTWNLQATMLGNLRVLKGSEKINAQYYRLKYFLDENKTSKVFVDFIPEGFGNELAMDLMLKDGVTRLLNNAEYIFDGDSFRKNPDYRPGAGKELKAFTVSWLYQYFPDYIPRREAVVAGADYAYPRVSMTPDGFVKVIMVNSESGKADTYRLKHGYDPERIDPVLGSWTHFVLEKDGDYLCLISNGAVIEKIRLNSAYNRWEKDSADLIGSFYSGIGEKVFISKLFIQSDLPRFGCGGYSKGEVLPEKFNGLLSRLR